MIDSILALDIAIRRESIVHPLPESLSHLEDVCLFRGGQVVAVDEHRRVFGGEIGADGVLRWRRVTV